MLLSAFSSGVMNSTDEGGAALSAAMKSKFRSLPSLTFTMDAFGV
jgi:hypothetical protein